MAQAQQATGSTTVAYKRTVNAMKLWLRNHFTPVDEEFDAFLDWLYDSEETEDWGDELVFDDATWKRGRYSKGIRYAEFMSRKVVRADGTVETRSAPLTLKVIEQNPNKSAESGRPPSEGERLVHDGHDVAHVILDGVYIGRILDGKFYFYEGKGLEDE